MREDVRLRGAPVKSGSIGLGLVTYNAPEKLRQSAHTVPEGLDAFVIVNDGTPYPDDIYPGHATIVTHPENRSVGHAKNTAFEFLMHAGIEHIFLMEDDVLIRDTSVFERYIALSKASGILHFNYALQGPNNFRVRRIDRLGMTFLPWVYGRTFDESSATPKPVAGVDYGQGTRAALYRYCIGAFCYYHRHVIEKVGLNDPRFINAFEHLDHTYRIIQAGFHPPYGWFPDLVRSDRYLGNIPNCMENSTIERTPRIRENQRLAQELFIQKHGTTPRDLTYQAPKEQAATEAFIKSHANGAAQITMDIGPDW